MTIGALTLSPEFDGEELEYTASTTNASNKVTATAIDPTAVITIDLDGVAVENGSSPTWASGDNILTITVTDENTTDESATEYVVTVTKVITPLEVTSVAGTTVGDTAISVTPSLTAGNSYVYATDTTVTLPALDDVLTTGWTAWNGTDDITATTGNEIAIAEITAENKAVKTGKADVVSLSE